MTRSIGTCLGIACLVSATWSAAAFSQVVLVETETYAGCHDIANIAITPIGSYLWGLDYPDEWSEYAIEIADHAFYEVQMTARAALDQSCTLRAIFTATDSGNIQTCDLTYVRTGMT